MNVPRITKERAKAKQHAKYSKARREWYREHFICVTCGRREAIPGRPRCQECIDRSKALREISDPGGDKLREQNRQRRLYRIEHHLCIDCGRPVTKYRCCDQCRTNRRFSHNKWLIKQKMSIEKGLST